MHFSHPFKHHYKKKLLFYHYCNIINRRKHRRGTQKGIPWGCLLAGLSPRERLLTLDLKADQRRVEVGFCTSVPLSPQTTATKQSKQSSLLDTAV